VTEACNEMDEEYGVERLQQMIESVRSLPSKEIIEAVVWENTTFAGARPQFDDIVLVAGIGLEDKAGQPPASPYEPRRAFPEEP
jgi:hypothetical protein